MQCWLSSFILVLSLLFSQPSAETHHHNFVVCFHLTLCFMIIFSPPSLFVIVCCGSFIVIWIETNNQVQKTPVKRLCKTHNVITVNGMFPGPTIEVKNGDTLVVNVKNQAKYNVTIHWYAHYTSTRARTYIYICIRTHTQICATILLADHHIVGIY